MNDPDLCLEVGTSRFLIYDLL